jgi:uncharacterized protein (DUF433 family)
MATTVPTAHIWLDDRGVAWIDNTNTKVKEVILDKLGYGSTPEQIHEQHPHLSMAQMHAAFAYYYDHKPEVDAEVQRDLEEVDAMRAAAGDSPVAERLRGTGLLG